MAGTLFVGDVHGCADALHALLRQVRPQRTVLLGDVFSKGPDPHGVWRIIKAWDADAVLGNHDVHVLQRWTPGVQLPAKAMRWLRRQPYLRHGEGWVAVHAAVNPADWRRTSRKVAIGLAEPEASWWTRVRDDRLVVHGHHAREGLRDHRPHVVGLDTGCVKGGPLTAYHLEDDAIVQVRRDEIAAA